MAQQQQIPSFQMLKKKLIPGLPGRRFQIALISHRQRAYLYGHAKALAERPTMFRPSGGVWIQLMVTMQRQHWVSVTEMFTGGHQQGGGICPTTEGNH